MKAWFPLRGPSMVGTQERRRFTPRPEETSPFWSSLGARLALLPLLGAAMAAALPPVYALPTLVIGFSGLLLAVRASQSSRAAALVGWTFGFGFFLAGLHWIGNSFLVDADRYGWMAVPAVIGLSAFLAAFPALAAVGTRFLNRAGVGEAVSLAVAWTAAEWLRGNILTGLPWNLVGYVWTVSDQTLQGVAVLGVYGLSLFTVLVAAAPVAIRGSESTDRRALRWWSVSSIVLLPVLLWFGGEARLWVLAPTGDQGLRLRVVQGNVPQKLKWQKGERDRIIQRYLSASTLGRSSDITLQIWPETALPVALANDPSGRATVAGAIPQNGVLLTGSLRFLSAGEKDRRPRNSLMAISHGGEILSVYDKARLVPFGEYVPLASVLPLEKLVKGADGFASGPGPDTMALPGIPPFQPLICYEAIFPRWSASSSGPEAEWLLNVTNDAWFGQSVGPYQHFEMARTRAVERGIPLVRAANTGISAVVDSLGRVTARLGLNEMGVLDAALPAPLADNTIYGAFGETVVLLIAAFFITASIVIQRRDKTARKFGKR